MPAACSALTMVLNSLTASSIAYWGAGADHAVAGVFIEEGEGDLVDCGLGGGDLGEDVDAVALLLDHPFDATDLAGDPAQAVLDLLFVLDVARVGALRHL